MTSPCILCDASDPHPVEQCISNLQRERAVLRARVTDLQRTCTTQLIELRAIRRGQSALSGQVAAFHQAIGQPVRDQPGTTWGDIEGMTNPADQVPRLRARLPLEEAFELATAIFGAPYFDKLWAETKLYLDTARIMPGLHDRLPLVADAFADLDYVVEGGRLTFGIDGGPVADTVHRANMTKATGPIDAGGKRLKPPGFRPPNIAATLEAQGWRPCDPPDHPGND